MDILPIIQYHQTPESIYRHGYILIKNSLINLLVNLKKDFKDIRCLTFVDVPHAENNNDLFCIIENNTRNIH